MCGIFGYKRLKPEHDDRLNTAIPLLSLMMEDRGNDSWGWTDGVNIKKAMGAISDSLAPEFYAHPEGVFHTRFATMGVKNIANQHPWKFESKDGKNKLIGLHNGMIDNAYALNTIYNRKFEVDSMHIFQHIADGLPLSDLQGYGAVVFYMNDKLYIGKFQGGSMTLAMTDIGWLWASTREAVVNACRMSGIGIVATYNLEDGKCFQIIDGELFYTTIELNVSPRIVVKTYDKRYDKKYDKLFARDDERFYGRDRDPYEQDHKGWSSTGYGAGQQSSNLDQFITVPDEVREYIETEFDVNAIDCPVINQGLCSLCFDQIDNGYYTLAGRAPICTACMHNQEPGSFEGPFEALPEYAIPACRLKHGIDCQICKAHITGLVYVSYMEDVLCEICFFETERTDDEEMPSL